MFQINFIFEMPSCFCTEMKDALRIMFLSQIHFVERDDYFYNTFKFGFDAILVAFGYQQKIKIDKNLSIDDTIIYELNSNKYRIHNE